MVLGEGPIDLEDIEIEEDDEEELEPQEMNMSNDSRRELDEEFSSDSDEPPPPDFADPDAEARMAAIEGGEHDEDDDFQEHSGINQYREFNVPRGSQKGN